MTTALVLGKFMPPHMGHEYLVNFAKNYYGVDVVKVLVCSLKTEPISGHLRYDWCKNLFTHCDVIHCDWNLPQQPEEDPNFWSLWTNAIDWFVGSVDIVFASEEYGEPLSQAI